MKTIKEYQLEIEDKLAQVDKIRNVCMAEARNLNKEELSVADRLLQEVNATKDIIDFETKNAEIRTGLAQPAHTPVQPEKAPKSVRDLHRDRFDSPGEFFGAVMRAGTPGGSVDPRLLNRAATGLNEAVPSDGGFMVQTDVAAEILKNAFAVGKIAPMARKITVSANANSIKINGIDETSRVTGSRYGGVRGYWVDEAAEKTASKPKFRQIELNLHKLIGLCYVTDELLMDSNAMQGIVMDSFANEIAFQLDDAIIRGLGTGQPLGVLNASSLVTQAKETGQASTTLNFENIVKMYARIFASSRANAVWLINQDVEPQLHQMVLTGGTASTPVYLPAGGISGAPYGTIFGRPVIPVEQCSTLGTVGDIILGDFANGYIMAQKGGLQTDMSIHVRFVYDESVFRMVLRIAGQPVLSSAITPYKGTNTLGHFVTLAAR